MENNDPIIKDSNKIVATIATLCNNGNSHLEFKVLSKGQCEIKQIGYDNWNGGTDIYGLFCAVPLDLYSEIEKNTDAIEKVICEKAEKVFKAYPEGVHFSQVSILPLLVNEVHVKSYKIQTKDLLEKLEKTKRIMIAVSTGAQRIQEVEYEYQTLKSFLDAGFKERKIENLLPFSGLWDWYSRWSDGSLPSYRSRREYIATLFAPLIAQLESDDDADPLNPIFTEPTGWERVDRTLQEIKARIVQASTEEQYQAIGLLCRETLISLGQFVYNKEIHTTSDGVIPSKTDAKRMLEAYFNFELQGTSNEHVRKHAKASLDLANDLTHRRTADYKLTALCAEATNATVNIVAIISGKRDPK